MCVLFAYRLPEQNNEFLFKYIFHCLDQVVNKYDFSLAGDSNIDLLDTKCEVNNHFSILIDTFDLKSLAKPLTCFKSIKGTLIDVLLTNKPKSPENNSLQK